MDCVASVDLRDTLSLDQARELEYSEVVAASLANEYGIRAQTLAEQKGSVLERKSNCSSAVITIF